MADDNERRYKALKDLRRLASEGASEQEMAAWFEIPLEKFNHRIQANPKAREAIEEGRALLRLQVKRDQLELAKTNATMAIYLGKIHCGQKEPATPGYGLLPGISAPSDAREQLFQKLQRAMDRRQQEPPAPGDPETIQ